MAEASGLQNMSLNERRSTDSPPASPTTNTVNYSNPTVANQRPSDVSEHCRLLVLCHKVLGQSNAYNHLLDRLRRIDYINVSEQGERTIQPHFISSYKQSEAAWGCLQAHRRPLGLICVAFVHEANEDTVNNVLTQFEQTRLYWQEHLVDARCILIGECTLPTSSQSQANILQYKQFNESTANIDADIREFLKMIFFVLERKRMDLSFERVEQPQCPVLPMEEKYRLGVENKTSKLYRRKCIGRCRKQVADYTLMTGLPNAALDAYNGAIELLRDSKDLLWLAAAYEGWSCAAMSCKYARALNPKRKRSSLSRVATFSATHAQGMTSSASSSNLKGHSKTNSIGSHRLLAASDSANEDDVHVHGSNTPLLSNSAQHNNIQPADIIERFRLALENYERFSFAATIEYECSLKTSSVFKFEMLYCEMETFLRERSGKYLDDAFTLFDMPKKASICRELASIFQDIGFRRKCAFYLRLSVLFHLNVPENSPQQPTLNDYKQMYPSLHVSLDGFGVSLDPSPSTEDHGSDRARLGQAKAVGWTAVHCRALHEIYTSAERSGYLDAAIRHLCLLLQVYVRELPSDSVYQLCTSLGQLCQLRAGTDKSAGPHSTNTHLRLPAPCNIILPPVPMTAFPLVTSFRIEPLPAHLNTRVLPTTAKEADIFIYNPYRQKEHTDVSWVVDCECRITLAVRNLLPFQFHVHNFLLEADGCALERDVSCSVSLPPAPHDPIDIHLLCTPKQQGTLTINGYSCMFISIQNQCRLRDLQLAVPPSLTQIQVHPELPVLVLSLADYERTEIIIYSGQTFIHALCIRNSSPMLSVESLKVQCNQPRVQAGANLLQFPEDYGGFELEGAHTQNTQSVVDREQSVQDENEGTYECSFGELGPERTISRSLRLFGLDPVAPGTINPEHIPYTGRVMNVSVSCTYVCVNGESALKYERIASLPLVISVQPAVTVAEWSVLPADCSHTRYLVLDLINHTENEAEIEFCDQETNRVITVQAKETCRVPMLVQLCFVDWKSSAAQETGLSASVQGSHAQQLQTQRAAAQRHVAQHARIKWNIPALCLTGRVPVGSLLASWTLLRQLLTPPVQLLVYVQDEPRFGVEELNTSIGQILNIKLVLTAVGGYNLSAGLRLACFQDAQQQTQNTNLVVALSSVIDCTAHMMYLGPVQHTLQLGTTLGNTVDHTTNQQARVTVAQEQPANQQSRDMGEPELAKKQQLNYSVDEPANEQSKVTVDTDLPANQQPARVTVVDGPPANHSRQYISRAECTFQVCFVSEGVFRVRPVIEWGKGHRLDGLDIMFVPTLSVNVSTR